MSLRPSSLENLHAFHEAIQESVLATTPFGYTYTCLFFHVVDEQCEPVSTIKEHGQELLLPENAQFLLVSGRSEPSFCSIRALVSTTVTHVDSEQMSGFHAEGINVEHNVNDKEQDVEGLS
jgi:hypothetical protein